MKIVFVNSLYYPDVAGGAERTLRALCEGLVTYGHTVTVVTLGKAKEIQYEVLNGVKVVRIPHRNIYWHYNAKDRPWLLRRLWHIFDIYNMRIKRNFIHILRAEQPDVISFHNLGGWSAAVWGYAKCLGIPTVQVLHDQYLLCPVTSMFRRGHVCIDRCSACKMMRLPHRALSRQCDMVIGVSGFILKHHQNHGYFTRSQAKIIHDARDSIKFRNAAKSCSTRAVVFGFIGNLLPNKGIDLLLRAFTEADIKGSKLLVAGAGPANFAQPLKEAFDGDAIQFLGHSKPEEFFSRIDILVVPSLWNDTFPGVVLESLMSGVPVIGSRRGGIPEMIADEYNGLLFEPTEPLALVHALKRVNEDMRLFHRLHTSTVTSSARYASPSAWVRAYEEVFVDLVRLKH